MNQRIRRVLVFLVAAWPLFLPSGVCLCHAGQGAPMPPGANSMRSAFDFDFDDPDSLDHEHAPGCPANINKNVDHSRTHQQTLADALVPAADLACFLDVDASQPSAAPADTSPASDGPIYVSLCTLLI